MPKQKSILILAIIAFLILIGYIGILNPFSPLADGVQSILTETTYQQLLTETELRERVGENAQFTVEQSNLYEIALASLPEQTVNLDSWFGTIYRDEKTGNDISLNIMDMKSTDLVDAQLSKLGGSFGIDKVETIVGDQTYAAELNIDTIGTVMIFSQHDKVITLQTSLLNDQPPLLNFDQMVLIAESISKKL